jgi:uncharacterized delta-60 repeat protein
MSFQKLVRGGAMLLLSLFAAAELRAQSALDGFDPNANDIIRVVLVQPDGKILIGGDFTALSPNGGPPVTRNKVARLNPDGTVDAAFNPSVNVPGSNVFAMAIQADGKILVGGSFTSIGGQLRNNLARLDPTTGLADSFDPNPNGPLLSITVQANGKILAGGGFTSIGGQTRNYIARLDPGTGLADSFNPVANNDVRSITVQADGRILAGGGFTSIGGQTRNRIARLNPTTGSADSFNPNANDLVYSIVVQPDGKILVSGSFNGANSIGGQTRNRIARLDPTNGLADFFDPNADQPILSLTRQPDGKILAGGLFTLIGGQTRNHIARLDPDTGLADSFDPNANVDAVWSIAVQADGKILAVGDFSTLSPNGGAAVTRRKIARLETDGVLDQTLNPTLGGFGQYALASAVQPDGKIVIGGQFNSVLGVPRNNIARLNTDGSLDPTFNPDADNGVIALTVQADGTILAGGFFTSIGGRPRRFLARLDSTGMADSFNPNPDGGVYTITVQPDGKILVGGGFDHIGGQPRSGIARLDPTNALADSFSPNANHIVRSIAVQADGKILAGGHFTSIGDVFRNYIARLDPTTGLADDSFNPNAGNAILAILVQADGKILVGGGNFNSIGGQQRNLLARLDPVTGLADSFNANAIGNEIDSLAVQADGKILAGGIFTGLGGQQRNNIARLDPTTGLADSFDPNTDVSVYSISVQPDGKILAGGGFHNIGGQPRAGFARLSNDTAALRNLAVTKRRITWDCGGSTPQFTRVTFESSPDNVNYTPLGDGSASGSSWILTGLSLPTRQHIYIRARGYHRGGYYSGSESITQSVRKAFISGDGALGNISTRVRIQTGDNAMIGGFIITGTQTKTVIVRGIGPSLPIPGALADPVIEVHGSSGELLATNDNWNDSLTRQQIIDSGLAPSNDLESALWGVINPGAYTVVVRGTNDSTGIGLFEVYDLDPMADSKLGNVATRGFVETGDNVMIGGVILRGTDPARVLFRAIGPSLTNFGVSNALSDPALELHDGNGSLVAANDNWRTDQEAEIIATGLPPSNNVESAILRDLLPGNYSAIVRGANNATGVALVEAYEVN